MKKFMAWICVLMLIVSLTSCGKQQSQEELEAWEAAEIERVSYLLSGRFYDADGNYFRLSNKSVSGRPIVMHFWATRNPESVQGLVAFEEAYEKYGDEVLFLMINAFNGTDDTMADAIELIKEKNYTFPVFYDRGGEMQKMDITTFPYTLFLDKRGEVIHVRNTQLVATEIGELLQDIR